MQALHLIEDKYPSNGNTPKSTPQANGARGESLSCETTRSMQATNSAVYMNFVVDLKMIGAISVMNAAGATSAERHMTRAKDDG